MPLYLGNIHIASGIIFVIPRSLGMPGMISPGHVAVACELAIDDHNVIPTGHVATPLCQRVHPEFIWRYSNLTISGYLARPKNNQSYMETCGIIF